MFCGILSTQNKNEVMGCLTFSSPVLIWLLSLADKAVMAPNLDSFGRDRAAYQEHSRQRRIAEREARRYDTHEMPKTFLHFQSQVYSQLLLRSPRSFVRKSFYV